MNFDAAPELRKSKGPAFVREGILTQKAGKWRVVAERTELGQAEVYDEDDKRVSMNAVLEIGDEINIISGYASDSEQIGVKVHNSKNPEHDNTYYFKRSKLEGKEIRLEAGK